MKKYQDKISIIIPIHNEEKWIKATIDNIKEQTYKNYEIILVNDASNDDSKSIIERYNEENIKIINLEKNQGAAIARNQGIKIATGRYICFQDADDLWDKYKLEKQLEFMRKNNCAFSYTSFEYFNNEKTKKVIVPKVLDYKTALKDTKILTISVMIDREKISNDLIYMPNIKSSEDIATWWKILKNGHIAYGIEDVLVYYRIGKKSLSSNKIKSAIGRWKVYYKIEKLGFIKSIYYFGFYVFNAIKKRI